MPALEESVRNVLSEVDKFLDALKSEKLSSKISKNKDKVIELLKKLRNDFPLLQDKPVIQSDPSSERNENCYEQVNLKAAYSHSYEPVSQKGQVYSNVPAYEEPMPVSSGRRKSSTPSVGRPGPPTMPLPEIPRSSVYIPPPQEQAPPPPQPKLKLTLNPDEDYENMYYGRWKHEGVGGGELEFECGDIIHVINRKYDKKGWWIGRMKDKNENQDKYGFVAAAYLIKAYMPLKAK